MKLTRQLLDYENTPIEDVVVFTANRVVKRNGELVMGAGNAKSCADAYYDAPSEFGSKLRKEGFLVLSLHDGYVGALVTKEHFKDKSDLKKVIAAIKELQTCAETDSGRTYHVPYPAIGFGGLRKVDVEPYVNLLPDNVRVYLK